MALLTSNQNNIAGFTESVDNSTGVAMNRTQVLAYTGLMSQLGTLALLTLTLVWS